MRAYEELLQYMEITRPYGQGVMTRCPAHPDKEPSLKVDPREGRVLLHCFAGCPVDEILGAWGLAWDALYDEPMEKRPEPRDELIEAYQYVKPDGSPYLVVERWRKATGGKSFKQRTLPGSTRFAGLKPLPLSPRLASRPTPASSTSSRASATCTPPSATGLGRDDRPRRGWRRDGSRTSTRAGCRAHPRW